MKEIKNFFINCLNPHTKYFKVYMCIIFSFLFNGIIFIAIGLYPAFLDLASNDARISIGGFLIAIWFVFLPQVSFNDKFVHHFLWATFTLVSVYAACYYWLNNAADSYPRIWDLPILIASLCAVTYLLYCLSNLVKIIFLMIQKFTKKILPAYEKQKNGLLYALESITSLFLAISSFLAGFWGIITVVKNIIL